jgi:hypothetical protein
VHHHRQQHRRVVGRDAVGDQAILQVGRLVDAQYRIPAVHLVEPVVGPGQVVQVDRAPEAGSLLGLAGGLDQAEGVDHDAGDVSLAVRPAGMGKICRMGYQGVQPNLLQPYSLPLLGHQHDLHVPRGVQEPLGCLLDSLHGHLLIPGRKLPQITNF